MKNSHFKKFAGIISLFIFAVSTMLTGCGDETEESPPQKVAVKAMKVVKQDVPVKYEYPGQLKGVEEVAVHSRLSGSVMEKYIRGGDTVKAGDPLFRIDSRQYETAILEAEANLHKAEAEFRNAREDLERNEMLFESNAVSEETVTNKRAKADADAATVESYRAALRKARENLDDTIVYAPIDGPLALDDVAVGTYASAGLTNLVTIGSLNPIYVNFSVSESEYLNILTKAIEQDKLNDATLPNIKIILSNGQEYPYEGQILAADRAMNDNSNSIAIRAKIPNEYGVLMPGMFARVRLLDTIEKDVVIVPQRAIQQLLEENFVLVVGNDGKAETRKVTLGEKVGSYYIVKNGLTTDDVVIVEGLTTLRSGTEVDVTMVTADEMGFSLQDSAEMVDKS